MKKKISLVAGALLAMGASQIAAAACSDVSRNSLQNAADAVYALNTSGGFHLNMWVTMVDETGKVCHVVTTGDTGSAAGNSEWLGSRIISAQKANTANAFSLDGVSISTGALYAAVLPGGSLYGLQHSNPVDTSRAYGGSPNSNGTNADFLKNKRIGGVNVFGGGLALYNASGDKVGAIGVSGDTSCTDHAFAWQVREQLSLGVANSPGGFETITLIDSTAVTDNLNPSFNDLGDHPTCFNPVSGNAAGLGIN